MKEKITVIAVELEFEDPTSMQPDASQTITPEMPTSWDDLRQEMLDDYD